jgi:preprotein translocase subunit SecG
MYTLLTITHIIIVLALISIILVQRGRSGGLVEALGGVESIFGTKTQSFFVKTTIVLSILFFASSIGLVYFSKAKGNSVMDKFKDLPAKDAPKPDAKSFDHKAVGLDKEKTTTAKSGESSKAPAVSASQPIVVEAPASLKGPASANTASANSAAPDKPALPVSNATR